MQYQAPPKTVDEFHARMAEITPGLPKRLQQCAAYLSAQSDRIALATVADLARAADVAPSAMMRFCQSLGFEGFSDMQSLFRGAMTNQLPDYATRLQKLRENAADSPAALLAEFIDAGIKSLENTATTIDQTALDNAVTQLAHARTIHLIGMRRAYPVASYMAYALEKMEIPAMLHANTGNLGSTNALQSEDAVIATTFAPYSDETLQFAATASERSLPVIMITDNKTGFSGLGNYLPVIVNEVDFGAFRSLSATLAVAITIAVAVGAKRNMSIE